MDQSEPRIYGPIRSPRCRSVPALVDSFEYERALFQVFDRYRIIIGVALGPFGDGHAIASIAPSVKFTVEVKLEDPGKQ